MENLEKELQEIYNTCEICGYKQSEKENRVRRYILGEHSYRLCEESYYDCVYKKKKQLGLAETSTDIICEWCKAEKDLVHNSGHYVDIDEDGQDEYFHEICYGKWYDAHRADQYLKFKPSDDNTEDTTGYTTNPCDYCGMLNDAILGSVKKWQSTDGCYNYTHDCCKELYIEEIGKEPIEDSSNLE